jgi:hypothetical protein
MACPLAYTYFTVPLTLARQMLPLWLVQPVTTSLPLMIGKDPLPYAPTVIF